MPRNASEFFDFLKANKDAIQALQSLVTILAVIVGGVWGYLNFGRKREKFPRAKLTHKFHLIALDAERRNLRVELKVENIGDTLIEVISVANRVQQVMPLASTSEGKFAPQPSREIPEIAWPMIDERNLGFPPKHREIEPKEPDDFHFDYIFGPEIETVVIYSYVQNARKKRPLFSRKAPKEIGWMITDTFHLNLNNDLVATMSKNQNSSQTETRQGTPKGTPAQTANSGAANAQGVAKPQPDKVSPPKSK